MKTVPVFLFLCIPLCSISIHTRAQISRDTVPTLTLTLNEVKRLAVENNPEFRRKRIDTRIAVKKVEEAYRNRIPEVYGDINLRNNLIIPVTPVPAKAFDPSAPDDAVLPLKFNTRWGANAGIHAGIDLFNPEKKSLVREAKKMADIQQTEERLSENDLRIQAGEAYLRAVISQEQLRLSISDTLTRYIIWQMSAEQYIAGRLLQSVLNSVVAERNSAIFRFEEAKTIHENARSELLYLLGYDPLSPAHIEFRESLNDLAQAQLSGGTDWKEDKDLQLIRTHQQEELTAIRLNALKAGYLPTLSLNGYYGANFFDNKLGIFQSANWYGNSFLSLGVKIPLTEGFERTKRIEQLQLEQQSNALAYSSLLHKNRLEFVRIERDIQLYRKKYGTHFRNFQLAEENLRLAREKYDSGRLLIGELYETMYSRDKEKTAYLQAAFDLLVAGFRMEARGW